MRVRTAQYTVGKRGSMQAASQRYTVRAHTQHTQAFSTTALYRAACLMRTSCASLVRVVALAHTTLVSDLVWPDVFHAVVGDDTDIYVATGPLQVEGITQTQACTRHSFRGPTSAGPGKIG